jgi:hypothetical protein
MCYSNSKFQKAKTDLAYSILHLRNPSISEIQRIEDAFLRRLLSTAAEREHVSYYDVQAAINHSGVCDLDLEAADAMIAKLCAIGDSYIGALSREQARVLRRIRELCYRCVERNDIGALSLLADIV